MTTPTTRTTLSSEQIVDTALQLISKFGADKLSMRQLSTELGVSLGATYRHVPTKDALLELCGQELFERSYHPRDANDDPLLWVREQVINLYDLMVQHPGLASRVVFKGSVDSKLSKAIVESLLLAGHPEESIERIGLVLTLYTAGAMMASAQLSNGEPRDVDTRELIAAGLDFVLHSYPQDTDSPKKARTSVSRG